MHYTIFSSNQSPINHGVNKVDSEGVFKLLARPLLFWHFEIPMALGMTMDW